MAKISLHTCFLSALALLLINTPQLTKAQPAASATTTSASATTNVVVTTASITRITITNATVAPTTTFSRPRGCVPDPDGPPRNFSIAPRWFFEQVVFPWDNAQCEIPGPFAVIVNKTVQYFLPVDRMTGDLVVSSVRSCNAFPAIAVGYFLFDFYRVFYGFPNFNTWPSTTTPPLFSFVILFCIPLSVLTLIVSLTLIRRLLKENLTLHIYYYHVVIVCADLIIYVVNALDSVYLFGFVLWPICYALRPASARSFIEHASDAANIILDAMYNLSCMTQALMALDRFLALYYPMKYLAWATKALVLKCLATVLAVNTAIGIMEVFSSNALAMHIANTWNGPVYDGLRMLGLARVAIRCIILIVGLVVQIFACTMVFVKMRALLKAPKSKLSASTNHSLAPCYLLFGTCVLSFVATGFACVALVYRNLFWFFGHGISVDQFTISGRLYKISIPICSGLGFYVHCLSSSQYRALLLETGPVKALQRHVFSKFTLHFGRLARLGSVQPSGLEASSSGTALRTVSGTDSTGALSHPKSEAEKGHTEGTAVISIHHV